MKGSRLTETCASIMTMRRLPLTGPELRRLCLLSVVGAGLDCSAIGIVSRRVPLVDAFQARVFIHRLTCCECPLGNQGILHYDIFIESLILTAKQAHVQAWFFEESKLSIMPNVVANSQTFGVMSVQLTITEFTALTNHDAKPCFSTFLCCV